MARRMNCLHARGLAQYVLTSYEVAQGPPWCSQLGSATLLSLQVARVSGPVRAARLCLPQLGSLVARSCVCSPALPPHEGLARGQQHSTRNQLCSPTKVARINGTVAVFSIIPSPDCFARAVVAGRNRPVDCGVQNNSQLGY